MEKCIFNKQKALELVDNDSELLTVLLQAFAETEFSSEKLSELIKSKKYEEAASYTHRVKGAGRQLAMEKLNEAGQALEDVLRGKACGDLEKLSSELKIAYDEGLEVIKAELCN